MRTAILTVIICGAFGVMLAYMGYPFYTWQYWVMVGLLACGILNMALS